jgi:hypothetical protein
MNLDRLRHELGICWLFFGYALALHVLDEASHDFLSVYLPNAAAIRRASGIPLPDFTFQSWIGSLSLALAVWLVLTPLAFHNNRSVRWIAVPVALIVGLANGTAHIMVSLYRGMLMPGVYSAPLMLLAGWVLLRAALNRDEVARA